MTSSILGLCDFQGKFTHEKVVLHIDSVRMVTLSKASSRSSTQFASALLQMWATVEDRKHAELNESSFVTTGTVLSGPLRHQVVVSPSKLMLFFGRSGEHITVLSMFCQNL